MAREKELHRQKTKGGMHGFDKVLKMAREMDESEDVRYNFVGSSRD